jgi:[ribosomal protein S5]-alanine N-acetyltransferase
MHVIETKRLHLRTLCESDCTEWYVKSLNEREVSRFLETRHEEQTHESVVSFVKAINAKNNEFLFGMFVKDDGQHIGNIKVGPIHPYHLVGDVSLWIGKQFWGRGFATEAITAVSRYSFEKLGALKLSAGMYEQNVGSYTAFLKAGYRPEGYRVAHCTLEGDRANTLLVGLSRQSNGWQNDEN